MEPPLLSWLALRQLLTSVLVLAYKDEYNYCPYTPYTDRKEHCEICKLHDFFDDTCSHIDNWLPAAVWHIIVLSVYTSHKKPMYKTKASN